MSNTRRWLDLLRDFHTTSPELVVLIQREDDLGIVAWIQQRLAERVQELADFRRGHDRLDQLLHKLTRQARRQIEQEEDEWRDLDFGYAVNWEIDKATWRLPPEESAEMDWYVAELRARFTNIGAWRRRLATARDYAGIEALKDPYADLDSD